MDTKKLIEILEEIFLDEFFEGLFRNKVVNDYSWTTTDLGITLIENINSVEEFSIFNEQLQFLGRSACSVNIRDLAHWIIKRVFIVGVERTVFEVKEYIDSIEVEVYGVLLLSSVNTDCDYVFCNGVQISNIFSVNDSLFLMEMANDLKHSLSPFPTINSCLLKKFKQQKIHIPNTRINIASPEINLPIEDLIDVKYCLSLSRPVDHLIESLAYTTIAPDNLPFVSTYSGFSITPYSYTSMSPTILKMEMENANKLLEKFLKLTPAMKDKMRISMKKLINYSCKTDWVEKAIDLRVCLESVFLSDDIKVEARYRLALRAALLLSSNINERKNINSIMKKVYDVTSSAVHTGKLSSKDSEKIPIAADYAKKAIIKLINLGKIDWTELELKTDNGVLDNNVNS